MKKLLLSIAALSLTLPSICFAQVAKVGYCLNPSGNWIPIATSALGGPLSQAPPAVSMYGQNNGTIFPLACDATGNLIISSVLQHMFTVTNELTHTGDTTETTVASYAIPPSLPLTSVIRYEAVLQVNSGNTGTCYLVVRYSTSNSGTIGFESVTNPISAGNSAVLSGQLKYRTTSTGIFYFGTPTGGNANAGSFATSYNTTGATYLNFNLLNSSASGTCRLESADVWISTQ